MFGFSSLYLLWVATQFASFILALSIHEASHAFAAYLFGDQTAKLEGRLTLNPVAHVDPIGTLLLPAIAAITHFPLIGWAKPVPVNPYNLKDPKLDHAFIAGAGPLSNLLQAAAYTGILWLMVPLTGTISRAYSISSYSSADWVIFILAMFCIGGIIINLLLAIFNLIPIPPLDGGWILGGVLPDAAAEVLRSLASIGFVIIIMLVYAGFFSFIFYPILNNYMKVFFPEYAYVVLWRVGLIG
jgi:Zn-dependent protease